MENEWIAFAIAALGYLLNGIPRYRKVSYVVWMISNTYWIYLTIGKSEVLPLMFGFYSMFCIYNLGKELVNDKKRQQYLNGGL